MTAKLTFLYLLVLFCCIISFASFAQKEKRSSESNDPIRESIARKEQKLDGTNLSGGEYNKLARINNKYKLSTREKKLQISYKDTLNVFGKIKLSRSYRKQYLLVKNVEKFRKKKVQSIQGPKTLKRMRESAKRTKVRDRKRKRDARRRNFLNLFK